MAVLRQNYETRVKPKLGLIEGWIRNGLSVEQVCENLGVSSTAFNNWAQKHIELRDTIERGRECAEIHVENALLKRALGYQFWEVTKERKKISVVDAETGETKEGYAMIATRKTLKHVVPDVEAQRYWLENRASKRWQRVPQSTIDESSTNQHILSIATLLNNPLPERQMGDEDLIVQNGDTDASST